MVPVVPAGTLEMPLTYFNSKMMCGLRTYSQLHSKQHHNLGSTNLSNSAGFVLIIYLEGKDAFVILSQVEVVNDSDTMNHVCSAFYSFVSNLMSKPYIDII